jgi:hypothetical protein
MWKCPKCKREFRNKNQWHTCIQISDETLFLNKPEKVREIYDELYRACATFSDLITDTTKGCIYFVDKQRYLVIKPQKNGLILEFLLDREEDVFPVIKIHALGKGRFAHRIKLDDPQDINAQVMGWIEDAHKLLMGKD